MVTHTAAQQGHDVFVVKAVKRAHEGRVGHRGVQAGDRAARARDPRHLAHDLLVVRRVAQTEADHRGIEGCVLEGQVHRIALDEQDVFQSRRAPAGHVEHMVGEIQPHHEQLGMGARDLLGDVTRAAAHIKHYAGFAIRARRDGHVLQAALPHAVHP